jgi:hypothetical protein
MVRQSPICAHIPTSLDRQRPAYRALCWDHNIKEPPLSRASCPCVDDGLPTVDYCSAMTTDGLRIFRKKCTIGPWALLAYFEQRKKGEYTNDHLQTRARQQSTKWSPDICGLVAWTMSSDKLLGMRYKLAQPQWKPDRQHHSQRKQSKQQARRLTLHYTLESDLESEARCWSLACWW